MRSEPKRMNQHTLNTNQTLSTSTSMWSLLIGIIFIAATMRAPLTSVGPLIGIIKDSIGISNTFAGFLTTLPLLAFAGLSPFAPRLAHRLGLEKVLFAALCLLATGIVLRSVPAIPTLLLGTIVVGAAIAICNVLMPSLVKKEFPQRIGLATGIYSVAMNLSAAIAIGVSVPLADQLGLGWNGALGIWGILVVVAIACWLPQLRQPRTVAAISSVKATAAHKGSLLKSSIAWQITIFMGVQSIIYYVSITWLPQLLIDRGFDSSSAGWMVSLMQFSQIPVAFIMPIIAARMNNQRYLVMGFSVLYLISISGFVFGEQWIIAICSILLGIAGGTSFSLAMMFLTLRTRTAHEAAQLSGMAQSIGYLLAATGPLLFGILHDITNGWTVPLILLFIASLVLFGCGMGAARNRYVTDATSN